MATANTRELYDRFGAAIAYVVVRHADGREGIGSAFHVGEGVFVTAKHVIQEKEVVKVATFARTHIRLSGEEAARSRTTIVIGDDRFKAHTVEPAVLKLSGGPYYHPDSAVDIAAFRVADIDAHTPAIPLGDHLDDWLGWDDFVLTEVIVLGFPPIPFASGPHLLAARGEVNALVSLRHSCHPQFLVSAMPRGGFSGGVVVSESGVALGIVTQSLVMDNQPEQLGYMAVLTVEPIYHCLSSHRLLPKVQADPWEDYWNIEAIQFLETAPDGRGKILVASVEFCDDGRQLYLEVRCKNPADRDRAINAALEELGDADSRCTEVPRDGRRITIEIVKDGSERLVRASKAAASCLQSAGYQAGR